MALLLLLLFLGLILFFIINAAAIITAMIAIVLGGLTITVLVTVWVQTCRSLKNSGYNQYSAHQSYQKVKSDLGQISEDLNGMRSQLQEAGPRIQEMEFLKYARRDDGAQRKTS